MSKIRPRTNERAAAQTGPARRPAPDAGRAGILGLLPAKAEADHV
jgi:hypothetical protein